jgi:hypothetical protein
MYRMYRTSGARVFRADAWSGEPTAGGLPTMVAFVHTTIDTLMELYKNAF